MTVDPRLLDVLEESEWAQVFFYLRDPPGFEFPSYELSHENWDRGIVGANGPNFYNHGPRDGVIDLANDIFSVINQFNPAGC